MPHCYFQFQTASSFHALQFQCKFYKRTTALLGICEQFKRTRQQYYLEHSADGEEIWVTFSSLAVSDLM